MRFHKVGAVAGVAILAFAAGCTTGGGAPSVVNIAIELPQQGSEKAASDPIINGIKLAVKEAGGKVGNLTVEIPNSVVYDDALNGVHDPQTGARNMQAIVSNPNIVAVIGPLNSNVGKAQIPISNEAGLLQCSPANTNEGLTKPEFGARDVRSKFPDRINYVRVVTTDDNQGPAAARYILENLDAQDVYIIDDTETFGKVIADNFQGYLEENGGTVVQRDGVPKTTTDYSAILTAAAAKNPEAIYFGGVTASGGARILKAAVQAGLGDIPFVGPDGIFDGSAETADSFLNLAGDDAANAVATAAAIGDYPGRAEFAAKYEAEYSAAPTGYAATGYACAQVVLNALERAGTAATYAELREKVRAAGVDPNATYTTVIGDFKFDANGDTSQEIISFYEYDPATKDWAFKEQLDFASE